jgi:hypothetical protein
MRLALIFYESMQNSVEGTTTQPPPVATSPASTSGGVNASGTSNDAGGTISWDIVNDVAKYLAKYAHVSNACRLSLAEEESLLPFVGMYCE